MKFSFHKERKIIEQCFSLNSDLFHITKLSMIKLSHHQKHHSNRSRQSNPIIHVSIRSAKRNNSVRRHHSPTVS